MTKSLCLTTNDCESFNSHFNQQFYKSQLTISIFLKKLSENIQTDIYTKSTNLNIPNRYKNKSILLNCVKMVISNFGESEIFPL